jgi:tetratricopeptide (TPR) repeat protein
MNLNKKIVSASLAVCALIGVYFLSYSEFFGAYQNEVTVQKDTPKAPEAVAKTIPIELMKIMKPGDTLHQKGYTITMVADKLNGASPAVPSISGYVLQKPVAMSVEAFKAIHDRLAPIMATLRSDPKNTDALLSAAQYLLAVGDQKMAESIWIYLSKADAGLIQPWGNLAHLYQDQGDQKRAETYYLGAIERSAKTTQYHRDLFELYVTEKRSSDAIAILQKGFKDHPTDYTLPLLLARFYKELGKIPESEAAYKLTIESAEKNASKEILNQIQAEATGSNP